MKKLLLILALALPLSAAAHDARIRYETYSKDSVYTVPTAIGRATLIQFEDDESVTGGASSIIGVGDAQAWNLGVKGNNIALKPAAEKPRTNIIVVTNKRTYAFELVLSKNPAYVVRFSYPDTQAKLATMKERELTEKQVILSKVSTKSITPNTNYVWRGSPEIKPAIVWDDGRFTFAKFPFATATPNFYKVLPDGSEAIINTHIDDKNKDTVVIEEVGQLYRLRLGGSVIELKNNAYTPPVFNENGTASPRTVRILSRLLNDE